MNTYHLNHAGSKTLTFKLDNTTVAELDITLILTVFYDLIYKNLERNEYVVVIVITPLDETYTPLHFPAYVSSNNIHELEDRLLEFITILIEDSWLKIYKVVIHYKVRKY